MKYTIKLSEDNSYVECVVIGEIIASNALKINIEAHAFGKQMQTNKFFVDMTNCRNADTTLRNYQYAYDDLNCPEIDRTAKTAVLVSPDDHSHDFTELVLVNSGRNICFFRDRELAELFIHE